ncbi:hypothetical protein B0H17DRAFT_1217100 [Mycena rosella]|uniref:Endonuclease/exonuclease/phosphatase domain-containing protein n=1 Tax=Mycena rosella TaxID=1033263 RepID=A0AAD7FTP8_MYCRO|nr:hypothetical protein B0H17DRAFT_1217100 [Mycena rosella]
MSSTPEAPTHSSEDSKSDNHHLFKSGVVVGIRKNIQVAQHVSVTDSKLRGRVVAVDTIVPTTSSGGFTIRVFGVYAPWDPGSDEARTFWPALTTLVNSTTTPWTIAGDLNVTISAMNAPTRQRSCDLLQFLHDVDGHDIWSNHPDRNRNNDWTSGASAKATSGNIIDRVVTSNRQYVDGEISVANRSQDFVPYTHHHAVVSRIIYTPPSASGATVFPIFHPTLNKARIKFPSRTEKHRHDNFRDEINAHLDLSNLGDVDPSSSPPREVVRTFHHKPQDRENHRLPPFTGGASAPSAIPRPPIIWRFQRYNRILEAYNTLPTSNITLLQYASLERRKIYRELFAACITEIQARREQSDCYRITTALKSGSTKHLVNPGEFVDLPIAVNHPCTGLLISKPEQVKEITRQYWSDLYQHEPDPVIAKPWLTTKFVTNIKACVQTDPFLWPRPASLPCTITQRHRPSCPRLNQWEKWVVKNLPDCALQIILKLHDHIIMNATFPGDLKDMWLTMFHKRGLRTDLTNWRGLLISNFLANSPISWLNYNLVPYIARLRILPDTQGGSLSPIKSTLTTSLGHHYLNDLNAANPETLTITSGQLRSSDPHLVDDNLHTKVVMVEATDDSYIFACTLPALRRNILAMEHFQFAYGWLTQWIKSMAYVIGPTSEPPDSVTFDSITNKPGANPLIITTRQVALRTDELDFLRTKVDDP